MNDAALVYILTALLLLVVFILKYRVEPRQNKILSQDLKEDDKVLSKTIFSKKYGIVGKPDEIRKEGNEIIPVEVKSATAGNKPFPSHIMQLAVYCLLIEDYYGTRPSHGVLEYKNKTFPIEFTNELRSSLLTQIKKIRNEDPEEGEIPPVCEDRRRCKYCGYAYICITGQKRLF